MLKIRQRIRVYGIVQGIGFRPFVKRTADLCRVSGDVCNKGSYVEIHVEGIREDVRKFRNNLVQNAPKVSCIIRVEEKSELPRNETEFRIIESVAESGEMFVSPDLAVCPECRRELFDPENRRYLHPFINCTNCGPRLTILDSMPYDRIRTTMRHFPMCRKCEYEYTHSETRRFHAQPVCCNEDGPQLSLIVTDTGRKKFPGLNTAGSVPDRLQNRDRCLTGAREILRHGGILAVKGIGGFHLACDASDEQAVLRLRKLKKRPMKPFAVMMRDLETVKRECELLPGEKEILDGVQKPILILKKKSDGQQILADSAAPENPTVGVMLPYAPVQLLLFGYPDGRPMTDMLVMTSGNPSGAPICRTTEEAVRYLSSMCDAVLTNDREILTRADDSVMQFEEGRPYMIRRSRGYAPLPFAGQENRKGQVLAIGGELKNTFALAKNELYYPSAYIGDMEDVRSVQALSDTIPRMERLLEIRPEAVACDLHPGYHTVEFAKRYAKEHHLPLIEVQHHYAHVLSCMAENGYEGEAIGVSFDGTGYGTDGTIWGGEFLAASPEGFVRLGSIRPFLQAGGDAASKEGWRIAVSLFWQMFEEEEKYRRKDTAGIERNSEQNVYEKDEMDPDDMTELSPNQKESIRKQVTEVVRRLHLCDDNSLKAELYMLEHRMNCVESTSAGRLFDAVSAILGIRKKSSFEGEASMALEFASDPDAEAIARPKAICPEENYDGQKKEVRGMGYSDRKFLYSNTELIRNLLDGVLAGKSTASLAGGFHSYLAELILDGVRRCRDLTGLSTVALSGGCFQNLLLLRKCRELLRKDGFQVLTHSLIPPNDGGIALGQAWAGMRAINPGDNGDRVGGDGSG